MSSRMSEEATIPLLPSQTLHLSPSAAPGGVRELNCCGQRDLVREEGREAEHLPQHQQVLPTSKFPTIS